MALALSGWVKCHPDIVTESARAADNEDVSINSDKSDRAVRRDSNSSQATQRVVVQRSRWQRMARTILLGTTTALASVVWVAQQYGVAVTDSLAFLGSSLLFVVGLIGIALAIACLLWLLRKLLRRK